MQYFCVVAGKELNCFDCDSRKDPRCHDPFNFTDHRSDMPPTRKCDGCCVKLVQHRGSCKGLHHFYNSTIFSFYCQLMKQSEELAQTRLTSTCSWWIMSVWLKEVETEYLFDLIIVFLFDELYPGKDGIMCFCEENRCNGSRKTTVLSINTFWIFSVILCILVH